MATGIGSSAMLADAGEHRGQLGEAVDRLGDPALGHQRALGVDQGDVVDGVRPSRFHRTPSTFMTSLAGYLCWSETPARTRGALMTRLDGLTSDEPFAIPATRTVPVFAPELDGSTVCEVCATRAGSNHDQQPARAKPRW
jgi:hypothetical protein